VSAEAGDQLLAGLLTTPAGLRADPAVFVHLGVPVALVGARSLALDQARAVLAAAERYRLHAYVVSLLTGCRTEGSSAAAVRHYDAAKLPKAI
jgi:hypothetical protein